MAILLAVQLMLVCGYQYASLCPTKAAIFVARSSLADARYASGQADIIFNMGLRLVCLMAMRTFDARLIRFRRRFDATFKPCRFLRQKARSA